MTRIIIHVRHSGASDGHDLEVSADIPVNELARHLACALRQPDEDIESFEYRLEAEWPPGKSLEAARTLAETGLWDGTHLILVRTPRPRPALPPAAARREEKGQLASLHSERGVYPVSRPDVFIGRSTPHTPPADLERLVDLKDEPHGDTVSRRHARLFFEKGQWYLEPFREVRNRTFCNDRPIEKGVPCALRDGDRLKFGRAGVTFHTQPSPEPAEKTG